MHLWPIQWYDRLVSTNAFVKEHAVGREALANGTVVCARAQTGGRGRQGRSWVSHEDRDLAFSVLLDLPPGSPPAATVPLVAGLAVADALEQAGIGARLKWPNDVLVGGAKICGILCEDITSLRGRPSVVVGIGINVNSDRGQLSGIDVPATSVQVETGKDRDLHGWLGEVLGCLSRRLETWAEEGFGLLSQEWLGRSDDPGRRVRVSGKGLRSHEGVFHWIDDQGRLHLVDDEGQYVTVLAGDVTRLD